MSGACDVKKLVANSVVASVAAEARGLLPSAGHVSDGASWSCGFSARIASPKAGITWRLPQPTSAAASEAVSLRSV